MTTTKKRQGSDRGQFLDVYAAIIEIKDRLIAERPSIPQTCLILADRLGFTPSKSLVQDARKYAKLRNGIEWTAKCPPRKKKERAARQATRQAARQAASQPATDLLLAKHVLVLTRHVVRGCEVKGEVPRDIQEIVREQAVHFGGLSQ